MGQDDHPEISLKKTKVEPAHEVDSQSEGGYMSMFKNTITDSSHFSAKFEEEVCNFDGSDDRHDPPLEDKSVSGTAPPKKQNFFQIRFSVSKLSMAASKLGLPLTTDQHDTFLSDLESAVLSEIDLDDQNLLSIAQPDIESDDDDTDDDESFAGLGSDTPEAAQIQASSQRVLAFSSKARKMRESCDIFEARHKSSDSFRVFARNDNDCPSTRVQRLLEAFAEDEADGLVGTESTDYVKIENPGGAENPSLIGGDEDQDNFAAVWGSSMGPWKLE